MTPFGLGGVAGWVVVAVGFIGYLYVLLAARRVVKVKRNLWCTWGLAFKIEWLDNWRFYRRPHRQVRLIRSRKVKR